MKKLDKTPENTGYTNEMRLYAHKEAGTYYVNCTCILAINQTISTGKTYLLCESPGTPNLRLSSVLLQDVLFNAGFIFLNLIDILTSKESWVHHLVKSGDENCQWMLVDPDYFLDKIRKSKESRLNDILLDFEY